MLAKIYDLEEAKQYDNLTNEKLDHLKRNPQVVDFTGKDLRFHTDSANYDPDTQVKVRFLHNYKSPVSFKDGTKRKLKVKDMRRFEKVIIHFHGGGFLC